MGANGLQGLSLREVAKKLKVTHQAPYHYFSDKESVVLELKRRGFDQLSRAMDSAQTKGQDGFDKLQRIGILYFDFCMENIGYFRAMFGAVAEGAGIRVPEAQRCFEIIHECIKQVQDEGYLKNYDAEIIALICWTTMHGLVSLALEKYPIVGGKYKPRELALQMIQLLHELYGQKPCR